MVASELKLNQRSNNKALWVAFVLVVIASICLEFYGRSCGFILVSDSLQFLSAAKSFREEGKFLGDDGSYYSYWPPLFPIILSASSNPLVLLSWVNLVWKLTIACSLLYFSNLFFRGVFWRILFIITSLLSVHFIMISVFVRSELLFMCLIFGNAYFALNLKRPFHFYGFLLTGFLMCIQRNAGLFWISGVCVWMVLDQQDSFFRNFFKAIFFFIISTSGLWVWNVYNTFLIPADFSFYKHPFFMDWSYNMTLIVETYVKILFPITHNRLLWVSLVLGSGVIVFLLRKEFNRQLSFVACTLILYTAGYASMVKLDVYEMDRYFSVVTPFVLLFFLMAMEKASESSLKWVRYGVVSLAILWSGYPMARTIKNVIAWHERSCLTESSI
jgi:hypothetical protein